MNSVRNTTKVIFTIAFFILAVTCNGQQVKQSSDRVIADYCDGCELMYEGIPLLKDISSATSLATKAEPGTSLELSGIVYEKDGKTPAKDIVLYIYHTDSHGLYSPAKGQLHAKRNGHLRGWVRTDNKGQFKLKSIRPMPYPNARIPAHIHIVVKEPHKTLYYIDEVCFADDSLITSEMKRKAEQRGGNLIISLTKQGDTWKGNLKITLGLNIPNYF